MNDAELRLALVLEASGEGLWEFLPAEGLVLLHPAYLAMLGAPARAQGEPVDSFFQRYHEEERRHLVGALFEAGEPFELRLRVRHADGAWRWHRARGRRIGNRVIVVESDISAELQREAAMADTLSRYLSLYDNAPMGFIVWDREGRITDWNKRSEQLFGHARNAAMGRRFISLLFPPQSQDEAVEHARRLLQAGGSSQGEYLNLAADGALRRCLWNNVALRSSKGSIVGVLSLVTDTTTAWQAEIERGHNEARNRALIETSPDAIFVLGLDGSVVNANHEAQRLVEEEDRSELVGRRMAEWVLAAQQAQFTADVLDNPGDRVGFVSRGEYTLVGRAGAERLIELRHTTLATRAGEFDGIVLFARDITRRRRDERELLEHRDRLEALVAERTAALEQARSRAESIAEAKAAFLANMSHEIRTPMNAVIGLTRQLLRTPLNHRQRDYLERISGAGKLLLGLLNDVLDYSKIEADRLELEQAPFVLDEMLDTVATLVGGRAQEKGIEFHYVLDSGLPHRLVGDSLRLTQVLVNLCSNALKFTHEGHVVVRVGAELLEGSRARVSFSVEDTGIGLSREQAGRLFQAFSQADASTSRRYGGTGLGLMISRRLVQLMGGEIHLVSAPGQGTTFYFDVEIASEPGDALHSSIPRELLGQTVRVVDDHPLAGEAIASALERMGLFAEVNIGLPPVDADSDHVENVIIDAEMPGARDYIERLRLNSPEPNRPRIILLAGRDIDASQRAMEAWWADDCLSKPVTVVRLLRALVGERRSQPESGNSFADLRGHQVLLVDDVPVNRMILAEMLGDWGLDADQAENAGQAIAMAAEKFYSAILMDVQMPGMDGTDATRRIRADGYAGPIIALTAHSLDAERERCIDAGMNDLVTKPIDPDRLARVLRQHLPPLPAETAERILARGVLADAASALSAADADANVTADIPAGGESAAVPSPAVVPESGPPAVGAVASASTCGPDAIDLSHLPGIDTETAMKRMQGKRSLYLKVLRSFCERHAGDDGAIAAALAEQRHDDAQRAAHSLKGLAGNIGADALSEAADSLERAIRAGKPTEWPLAALTLELAQVIGGLKAALGEPPVGETDA